MIDWGYCCWQLFNILNLWFYVGLWKLEIGVAVCKLAILHYNASVSDGILQSLNDFTQKQSIFESYVKEKFVTVTTLVAINGQLYSLECIYVIHVMFLLPKIPLSTLILTCCYGVMWQSFDSFSHLCVNRHHEPHIIQ